jgi:hypothetical protein
LLKIDVDEVACWWKNSEAAVGSLEQMEFIKVFVEKYKGNVNFIRVEFVESFSKL